MVRCIEYLAVCLVISISVSYGDEDSKYVNLRPIIAVIGQEVLGTVEDYPNTVGVIRNTYTRFAEAAGARVVPVRTDLEDEQYEYLFNSTNGAIFPGGSVNVLNSTYARIAKLFFNWAVKSYDRGEPYPIWGSCLGAQMIAQYAINATEDIRYWGVNEWNFKHTVNFTDDFQKGQMYKDMPEELIQYAREEPVGQHYHKKAVLMETYLERKEMQEFFLVTSTRVSETGKKWYIASMEGRKYPFFFFAFHPEKNIYEMDPYVEVLKTPKSIRFAQHLGMVFVDIARQNKQAFPSEEAERAELIHNYPITHVLWFLEMDMYLFESSLQKNIIAKVFANAKDCGSVTVLIVFLVLALVCAFITCIAAVYVYRKYRLFKAKTSYDQLK